MYLWQQHAYLKKFKDKIALRNHSQGEVFSWLELAQKVDEIVFLLQRKGMKAGYGIALCGKNNVELLCHYLAVLQLNARVLVINPAFPQEKIEQICLLNGINLYADVEKETTEYIILQKDKSYFSIQPLTLTLTSGSTGVPKAVVHDISAHLENAKGVCRLLNFTHEDSWLLSLPLYHVSGQGIIWRWLLQAAELHFPEKDFYQSVVKATHVSFVTTQLQRFLTFLQSYNVVHFKTKHVLLGGTQIPITLTQQLNQLNIQSYTGYGLTEMASTVFAKQSNEKPGVGLPLHGREYCLVKDEVWLRGAGLGLGYWYNGEIVSFLNQQGWLATKDKVTWLNNELVILGRLDNMFISGGENIQPEEIEQVILKFELVEQVFVLPVEDAEFGQRPVAIIKFKQDFSLSAVNKLRIWLSDKIEKFKQPINYFPLTIENWNAQGAIKISRVLLKAELNKILGKS